MSQANTKRTESCQSNYKTHARGIQPYEDFSEVAADTQMTEKFKFSHHKEPSNENIEQFCLRQTTPRALETTYRNILR